MSIKQVIERLKKKKSELENSDDLPDRIDELNAVKQKLEDLERRQAEEQREKEQQEMRERFELPKDYDSVFGVQGLNEEIHSLIQQVASQYEEFMNAKMGEQEDRHRQEMLDQNGVKNEEILNLRNCIKELEIDEENNLKRIEELNSEISSIRAAALDMENKLRQAKAAEKDAMDRARDAEQKRDAAASEIESLKTQIDELESRLKETRPKTTHFVPKLKSNIEDKPIKSSLELAMEGENFRGKVEKIEPPRSFRAEVKMDQTEHDAGGNQGIPEAEQKSIKGHQPEEREGNSRMGTPTVEERVSALEEWMDDMNQWRRQVEDQRKAG